MKNNPIPDNELLNNSSVFLRRQQLSRLLFLNEVYKKIVNVHGNIFEFGVRWGQNLSTLISLRGIYEPFNYTRKIVGFDTFSGFPSINEKDGEAETVKVGALSVTENYEDYLENILKFHESENPISHIKKFEIVKGDVTHTLDNYLNSHPETIIAFAYFDFDIYEPTKFCLERIKKYLCKGSIIGFDELNHPEWPGETIAFKEILGLSNYRIERLPYSPTTSFIEVL
ncbi:MAG: crotonobetainyl-CoA--carnitine CoA-transferase [Nanoarchaeota archaeon]|nr:crotonobetainyl-CoA--carnitine CoA-transferase [Nanoarchaeota archaeon]